MKNLVDVQFIVENKENIVLVDATNNFLNPQEGKEKYAMGHIPGAFHIDLHDHMCSEVEEHGGRDPLPKDLNSFKEVLESFGISNHSTVVVYDENMVTASRFWWMCKYIGLEKVFVLNGTGQAWMEADQEATAKLPVAKEKGQITMELKPAMVAEIEEVLQEIGNPETLLLDSRVESRYRGENEVIDKVGGHIPSAKNYYFGHLLCNGFYKDLDFLKAHFQGLENYKKIIIYCGSGVSAPINGIALDALNIPFKLYVGSWSDYISYAENKIAIGQA